MTDLSDAEMKLAEEYSKKYKRLSVYDTFALAIAKKRSWTLLTGDQPLRNLTSILTDTRTCLPCRLPQLLTLDKLLNAR